MKETTWIINTLGDLLRIDKIDLKGGWVWYLYTQSIIIIKCPVQSGRVKNAD